ncbi:E3 ubiquitin-protein ligase Midline-1-like [Lethenteron reissneri]|uniref:E3 ubiquitin-protein ligase Midline-1-like n=1 Tax=Lethenteron reissneri TaxID=7753 RepID=UPI002AB6DAB5|nr:E3 ubiquitin-protein ligase Midline-1-like [Lethenteron reissneri]
MASAPSATVDRELSCPICLATFDCPVILDCGHASCPECLEDCWKQGSRFSCPQCPGVLSERPQRKQNVELTNLAGKLRVGDEVAFTAERNALDDPKAPAVKNCPKREKPSSVMPLKPHAETRKLTKQMPPIVSSDQRRCKKHEQEFEFYCKKEVCLVCKTCTVTCKRSKHVVKTLEDEHRIRKVPPPLTSHPIGPEERVRGETRAVDKKRKKAEASLGRNEAARKDVQESIAQTKARISGNFALMRATLDEDERTALDRVDTKGCRLLSQIDKNIAHYEREVRELQAAATCLEALEEEMDSLAFLKIHLEKSRTEGSKGAPTSSPSPEDIAAISALQGVVVKLLAFMYGRSPTLDPNSAHNDLQISSDLRTVTLTPVSQRRPKHPHRFDSYAQALCSESFSSGQHYWEVNVEGLDYFEIGVAYGTIPRKGIGVSSLGKNDSSWVLCKHEHTCSVVHDGLVTSLLVRDPPQRVGIHLHWEAGLLSFYDARTMELLHSVEHTFTGALYPALYLDDDYRDTMTILDLSCASREYFV